MTGPHCLHLYMQNMKPEDKWEGRAKPSPQRKEEEEKEVTFWAETRFPGSAVA